MRFFNFRIIALCLAMASCTLDKTDFEAETSRDVTEYFEFKEAVTLHTEGYKISIEALNGIFYKGYNEIRLRIFDAQTNQAISRSETTFLPILSRLNNNKTSCPHRYNLVYNPNEQYYLGYAVFTSESNATDTWEVYIGFTNNHQTFTTHQSVVVQEQSNKNLNMTSFTGNDGEQYVIALISPQKPKVAENELIAGIYKYNSPIESTGNFPDPSQFSYSEVSHHTLLLDPRMPEPSMGNHSSPNNLDLTQQPDGLYHGVVNYTMTGNWTLNFILLDPDKKVIKGTEVPTDFTPGVEGVKSELHIDVLF